METFQPQGMKLSLVPTLGTAKPVWGWRAFESQGGRPVDICGHLGYLPRMERMGWTSSALTKHHSAERGGACVTLFSWIPDEAP